MNYSGGKEQAQVFSLENPQGVDFYENLFSAYNPLYLQDGASGAFSGNPAMGGAARKIAINTVKSEIHDYSVIPSTMTLLKMDAVT